MFGLLSYFATLVLFYLLDFVIVNIMINVLWI